MQFERFAKVFVRQRWSGWFAFSCIAIYLLFMQVYPCLPVQTPSGEAVAISRGEYLILYLSAPSAYVWQWTGGMNEIHVWDRFPAIATSTVWLVPAWILGMFAIRSMGSGIRLRRLECYVLAFLVGNILLQEIVFASCRLMGLSNIWPTVFVFALVMLGLTLMMRAQHRSCSEITWDNVVDNARQVDDTVLTPWDLSFSNAWFRRTYGLLFLATIWLGGFQLFASLVPTADVQVRSTDW